MQLEAAYILSRRPFKESSLLLDVFTANHGFFTIVANGALKNKHSWSALLQVFQPLLISWSGRSSLKTLTAVESASLPALLTERRLFSAYYINELILKFLPKDIQGSCSLTTLFVLYSKCIDDLSNVDNLELPLRLFEYHLLDELDYLPNFKFDIHGNSIHPEIQYHYLVGQGFVPVEQFARVTSFSNQYSFSGSFLLEYAQFEQVMLSTPDALKQSKYLMRTIIGAYLGGVELKSKTLFQTNLSFRRKE